MPITDVCMSTTQVNELLSTLPYLLRSREKSTKRKTGYEPAGTASVIRANDEHHISVNRRHRDLLHDPKSVTLQDADGVFGLEICPQANSPVAYNGHQARI